MTPPLTSGLSPCCDDLASALAITFIVPDRRHRTWLAYGADFDSVSSGAPEIRFWPIQFCPFCGQTLPAFAPAPSSPSGHSR
jgi:hypothetical protein